MTYNPAETRQGAISYFETRLRTASSLELTLILHEVLLESLRQALDAGRANRIEERVRATNRAVAALVELQCSLDHERGGEIARSLDRLYRWALGLTTGVVDAETAQRLEDVRRVFTPLRDAWAEVAMLGKAEREAAAPERAPQPLELVTA